jgi:hypothetical protein
LWSPCGFLRPLVDNVSAGTNIFHVSDAHSFTVVSAEQVEMALLSGLQLNAYYSMTSRHEALAFCHGRISVPDSRRCLRGPQRTRLRCRPLFRRKGRSSRPIQRSQSGLHSARTLRPARTWCASLPSAQEKREWLLHQPRRYLGSRWPGICLAFSYLYGAPGAFELRSWVVDVQSNSTYPGGR